MAGAGAGEPRDHRLVGSNQRTRRLARRHPRLTEIMADPFIPTNSLVLYRTRPARVAGASGDKLSLEIEGGETAKVRPKDVTLLHPGPLRSLAELRSKRRGRRRGDGVGPAAGRPDQRPRRSPSWRSAPSRPPRPGRHGSSSPRALYFRQAGDQVRAATGEEVEHIAGAAGGGGRGTGGVGGVPGAGQGGQGDGGRPALPARGRGPGLRPHGAQPGAEGAGPGGEPGERARERCWTGARGTTRSIRIRCGRGWRSSRPPTGAGRPANAAGRPGAGGPDVSASVRHRRPVDRDAGRRVELGRGSGPGQGVGARGRPRRGRYARTMRSTWRRAGRGVTLHLPEMVVPMLPPATTPLLGLGLSEYSPALSFGISLDAEAGIYRPWKCCRASCG